jgi:hypothetical protein
MTATLGEFNGTFQPQFSASVKDYSLHTRLIARSRVFIDYE